MAATDDATLKSAITKTQRGEKLNREESRALQRAKREQLERNRTEILRTIPKKLYAELAGRQIKVVNEQGDTYGLPIRGETVDLFQVVKAYHDLLAKQGHKLLKDDDDEDPGGDSPWLEEQRKQKALVTRLQRLEMERQLLRRDVVHEKLARLASVLQNAGEQLQRQNNLDGFEVLSEAIAAMGREVETLAELPSLSDETAPPADY
jgi:hypothetical protein